MIGGWGVPLLALMGLSYMIVIAIATSWLFRKITDSWVGKRVPDDAVMGAAIAALLGGLVGPLWLPFVRWHDHPKETGTGIEGDKTTVANERVR